jgi:Domain of unknown function (DUF222)
MFPSVVLPDRCCPWPGDGGPLLATLWATLTSPGPNGAGLLPVDVMTDDGSGVTVVHAGLLATAASVFPAPGAWPEGVVPPDGFPSPRLSTVDGPGSGFGQGDRLDVMPPGVTLAGLAEDAHGVLAAIDDDCLTGVIRAWRRIISWGAGRELAAVAELSRRRPADGLPGSGREYVADELAAALTLTGRAAQEERDLAWQLANVLPATLAALAEGQIDLARAKVIADGTAELDPDHAAAVEAAVLPKASGQTTGQLRAAVAKAVLTADPAAASRQREAAQARAHVSCWTGPSGTGHLEGHDLPSAQTLAADARLGQIATAWKAQGAQGGMDLLRAHAYLGLLLGHDTTSPPASLLPSDHLTAHPAPTTDVGRLGSARPGTTPAPTSDDGQPQVPAGLRAPSSGPHPGPGLYPESASHPDPGPEQGYGLPPVAAMINLTVPLTTLLRLSDNPGEAGGYGPVASDTARLLAGAAARHPATRWQFTVTSPDGHAVGTGTARPMHRGAVPAQGWTVTVIPIALGDCDHHQREPGYRPSPALARLIRARTTTCSFPGCRRPARQCDLDHSIAYEDGGPTCPCNLAPLCRHHHRVKQAEGWSLIQPVPGVLVWLTPAGRRYTTLPSQHPT